MPRAGRRPTKTVGGGSHKKKIHILDRLGWPARDIYISHPARARLPPKTFSPLGFEIPTLARSRRFQQRVPSFFFRCNLCYCKRRNGSYSFSERPGAMNNSQRPPRPGGAKETPGDPRRPQESPGDPRRAQESPGEPRRAQASPGEARRAWESPGEPSSSSTSVASRKKRFKTIGVSMILSIKSFQGGQKASKPLVFQ